jgi:molybdate transport system ATP-binding protein
MSRPFITLDNITLRLGEQLLFPDTTWRIHEGEQWVVVGSNGCGKSTLLGAFNGRTPVVGGEVWYHFACADPDESYPMDGTIPEDHIAWVSQEDQSALARAGSDYHQARWNASDAEAAPKVLDILRKRTGAPEIAIKRAVARAGISHRLRHPLPALSNGELRRVLIAEALLKQPRLLILDDPFAGLDTDARERLSTLIGELMNQGIQLVVVVRRPEEIPPGATHLLYAVEGKVRVQGPLEELRNHRLLRRFFASPKAVLRTTKSPEPVANSDSTEIFSLKNVTVRYDKTVALDHVSWTVRAGERWALVGHNGSGKSTLLSLLTGDNLQAYSNDVQIFGKRRGTGESIWAIRARIGWLSPELQWHYPGNMPVDQIVASGLFDTIGLQRPTTPKQRAQVKAWLEHFELPAKVPFASLGAGAQRMALLARALIKTPDLILLDEPCQGLDAPHRKAFHRALANALQGHPCALVYITHHTEDLPPIVDRALRLEEGCVISVDS